MADNYNGNNYDYNAGLSFLSSVYHITLQFNSCGMIVVYSRRVIIIILSIFLTASCSTKDTTPFEVTYQVNLLTDKPLTTTIFYTDSTGRVTLHMDEKSWSQKVTLKPGQIASLMVTARYDLQHTPDYNLAQDWHSLKEESKYLVAGYIVHPNKTVRERSEDMILISLLPSETRERRGLIPWLFR
ncbi:MAG: hypothetical protein LBV43_14285 [Prevotella sp.]|nr:hypothetical protein [Prevotella sp.]